MADEEYFSTQPPAPPSLPQYPELIMAAIEALNDKNGSSKSAISKHIEDTYGELPAAHTTLISHHLNKLNQSGELVMVKNNYMKPDPNAPPRRGRGRPPKPRDSVSETTVVGSPRPRGRPPKEDGSSSTSGRPRGRPPKKAKTAAPPPPNGERRGRGRPPKVKPSVAAAPIGC